jgi:hypothetical protein
MSDASSCKWQLTKLSDASSYKWQLIKLSDASSINGNKKMIEVIFITSIFFYLWGILCIRK